jgi:hypothetical protein
MTARVAIVSVWVAASLIAFGQTPAPSSVCAGDQDAALKARVNEFFQYFVEGKFAKAMPLVAQDTQEEYFAGGKAKLNSFNLDTVKFTDNCTKAVVTTTVVRDWQIRLEKNEVTIPMTTTWKIEDGKWVWYHDTTGAWLTPMGPSNVQPPTKNADGTPNLPKNLSPDVIQAAARAILQQSSIDRNQIVLSSDKVSNDRVVFTNAVQGSVGLMLTGVPELPGLEVKLDKSEIGAREQASILISYDPQLKPAELQPFTLRLTTAPLNQVFDVRVTFSGVDIEKR